MRLLQRQICEIATFTGLGICLAVNLLAHRVEARAATMRTPDETIIYLSSLRHGLIARVMDEETKALLDEVLTHPEKYRGAIIRALEMAPTDQGALRRVATALELARRSGRQHMFAPHVRRLLPRVTVRLLSVRETFKAGVAPEQQEVWSEYWRLLALRNQVIEVLGEYGDPGAVEICIQHLAEERRYMSGADVVMLRYLAEVAPLRPGIRPDLERLYESPTSPLRNDPNLKAVLDAMKTAENEAKIEGANRKQQDVEGRGE